jgi:hypothetical protein
MTPFAKRNTARRWPSGRAGDQSGIVGGEEHHAARDLLRLAEPADRNLRQDALLQHVLRHRLHHLGVDVAGADGVDGDADIARPPAPAPW